LVVPGLLTLPGVPGQGLQIVVFGLLVLSHLALAKLPKALNSRIHRLSGWFDKRYPGIRFVEYFGETQAVILSQKVHLRFEAGGNGTSLAHLTLR
jgi:hypothetical protein